MFNARYRVRLWSIYMSRLQYDVRENWIAREKRVRECEDKRTGKIDNVKQWWPNIDGAMMAGAR